MMIFLIPTSINFIFSTTTVMRKVILATLLQMLLGGLPKCIVSLRFKDILINCFVLEIISNIFAVLLQLLLLLLIAKASQIHANSIPSTTIFIQSQFQTNKINLNEYCYTKIYSYCNNCR